MPSIPDIWALLAPDVTDDTMYALAAAGKAAGPDIYADVPSSMWSAPRGSKQANEQAVYWLSLATRRADYEGNRAGQDLLWYYTQEAYNNFDKTPLQALDEAIDRIQTAPMNEGDKATILAALQGNRTWFILRTAATWGVGVTLITGAFMWSAKRGS